MPGGTASGVSAIAVGRDALGPFNVEEAQCSRCSHQGLVIHYKVKPKLDPYVRDARSLVMRKPSRQIGLTCGCYAKLHRQIVHINGGKKK